MTTLFYDYKAEFHDAATELIAQSLTDRTERMAAVNALTDAYLDSVGKNPDTAELERLTDYILREELTDRHPDKVTNTEYPFFSAWQLDLRRDRETSDTAAESHGADGRDYRPKTKRARTPYENRSVDAGAKIRNAARAAQYKRDTATVTTAKYNLRDTGGELTEPFVNCVGIGKRWLADMGMRGVAAVNDLAVESVEEYVREAA